MVEVKAWQHGLPAAGRVARVAGFLELTTVWIDVAVVAAAEFHVLITGRAPGAIWLVALLTRNLTVEAGQCVAGLRVIKVLGGLPTLHVVALRAIVTELPLVRVGVTRSTCRRLAKE